MWIVPPDRLASRLPLHIFSFTRHPLTSRSLFFEHFEFKIINVFVLSHQDSPELLDYQVQVVLKFKHSPRSVSGSLDAAKMSKQSADVSRLTNTLNHFSVDGQGEPLRLFFPDHNQRFQPSIILSTHWRHLDLS